MSMRDKIAKALTGIKAYHSSPHDFDRFDLSKIGTGEGAQVYGHGIYAAENPAVSGQGGQYWNQFMRHPALSEAQQHAGGRLAAEGFDKEKAIAATQRDVNDWLDIMKPNDYAAELRGTANSFSDKMHAKKMLELRQGELEALVSGKAGPRTYELNINADPAHFLDWDKGLHRQSPEVQQALSRYGIEADPTAMKAYDDALHAALTSFSPSPPKVPNMPWDPLGKDIYHSRELGLTRPEASERLQDAGIPGIKYLDQGSRAAGTGSSNYVVFDPSIIDITKKYAVPGAIGAGAMGGIAAQDQYEVAP